MTASAWLTGLARRWRWLLLYLGACLLLQASVTPFRALAPPVSLSLQEGWHASAGLRLAAAQGGLRLSAEALPATATRRLTVSPEAEFIALEACAGGAVPAQGVDLMLASRRGAALDFNRQFSLYGFPGLDAKACTSDRLPRRAGDAEAYLQLQLGEVGSSVELSTLTLQELLEDDRWRLLRRVMLLLGLLLLLWPYRVYLRETPRWLVVLALANVAGILVGCLVSVPLKADIYALITGGRELAATGNAQALLTTPFPVGGFSLFTFGHAVLFASAGLLLAPLGRYAWPDLLVLGLATETLQMFVPGRGPGLADVMVDWSGLALAALLFSLFRIAQRVGLLPK